MATTALPPSPAVIAARVLDFSDAEFAAAPGADVHAREVRLLDTAFDGIAIAAPRRIDVDAQASLPIAIALRCDGERDWDLPLGDNGLLVATDLRSGHVGVVPALVPLKVLASRGGAQADRAGPVRPPADALAGHGAQVVWTEARGRLGMPWQRGLWRFALVSFDWLSNLVDVELSGGPDATPAMPAPRPVQPPPAVRVPGPPTYLRLTRTPPAPTQGVQFKLTLDERHAASRLVLDAAFVLPAPAHALAADLRVADGGQERDVAAVLPMTLLLVGANTIYPWRRDFAVPAYGAAVPAGARVEGAICLDAFDGMPAPGPGHYAGYLVVDGAVLGPQPIHVTR
jgi:hypothetical protein